jgi:hypothetical protein
VADGFTIDVDAAAVVAALLALGDTAQPYVNAASHLSADELVVEAKARLQRKLGPNATGEMVAGITDRPAYDGNGYVVISSGGLDNPLNLPLWLEKGTKKGAAGSHSSPALAYFYSAAQLEEAPHFRHIQEALRQAIADRGLGDA